MVEDFTVEKIERNLRIEEESRKHDATYLNNSKVNYVSRSEPKKNQKGHKRKGFDFKGKQNKKRSLKCYHCNKKGHYIKDCRLLKKVNASKEGSSSANKA